MNGFSPLTENQRSWLAALAVGPRAWSGKGNTGFWARKHGYSEWMWIHTDGRTAGTAEIERLYSYWGAAREDGWNTCGQKEKLTAAGIAILRATPESPHNPGQGDEK